MIYKFKNKDGSRRKFMVTWYHGFGVNEKNRPESVYIENGEFDTDGWDEDIIEAVSKLEIGDRHDEYGPCGLSHCAIYRYA